MLDETQLRKFVRYKKIARNALTKYQHIYDNHVLELKYYLEHGVNPHVTTTSSVLANWEFADLRIPEIYWETAAEVSMSQQHQMDYPHLMRSLAYGYVEMANAHYGMHHFLARFGRERTGGIGPSDLFRLCLAELAGLEKESRQLFHAFASAYRRRSIIRSKSHVGDFVVLLYARYLGMELAPQVDNFAYQALLEEWDSPDLAKVSALVLFICDEQVRQMLAPPSKFYCEFDNGDYCLLPLTALLVLKLRQNRGLTNPELTHPAFGLLNTMLAPAPLTLHYDELLLAVLQKMQSQGFAIDASYALTR